MTYFAAFMALWVFVFVFYVVPGRVRKERVAHGCNFEDGFLACPHVLELERRIRELKR